MFQHHDLMREYRALLRGRLALAQTTVRLPIAGRAADWGRDGLETAALVQHDQAAQAADQ